MMKNASPPLPFPGVRLVLAVVLTGVAAGLAAASLSWMIHFVEHLAFGQSEAQSRIVTEGTTPERRMGALLCAGLLVTLCWTWLQVKGRPVVGIKGAIAADTPARRHPPFFEGTVHALLQIVAVGSGAPIGRELAPRELGSLFSGRICDRLGIDEEMRRLLVASGSAAGLAGVYQVPFAGAIFALEILLGRFTVTYGIVALAVSVIATVVARVEVTTDAFYVLGQIDGSVVTVLWSAVIGTLVGLPAAAFRRAVLHAEQYRAKQWDVLWALPLALLLTEVVAIWLPQVLGNGRSVAQTAYDGITMGMCLALILGKSVVVLATLRGGAYGGTLQPAVALGALSGILLGTGLHQLPVWEWLPPSAAKADLHSAAVAGSAAFLAVSMNAPLTAFGLVMGFTGQHDTAALPLLASVSAGMGMAHLWPQKKAAPAHESAAHGAVEQVAVRLPAQAAVPLAAVAGQGAGAGVPGMLQARDVVREPLPAVVATNMGTVAHEGTSTPPSRLGRQPAMAEAGITEMARIHDAGASVAETVGAGRVRTDVAGEVRAGTVMADVADRAMTGTVVADVADQAMAGTVVADMADRAMAGTVVADVAEQAMAGTVVAKVADVDEPVAAPRRKAATRTRTKAATEGTTKRAAPRRRTKAASQQAGTSAAAGQADMPSGISASMDATADSMAGPGGDLPDVSPAPKARTRGTRSKTSRKTTVPPVEARQARQTVRQTEVRVQRQTAEQTTIQWQDQDALGPAGIRIVREAIEQAAMQWREQETRLPVELTASPSPVGQLEIAWPGPEKALPGAGRALYLERERASASPQEVQPEVPTEIRVSVVISVPPGERSPRTRR